MPIRRTLKNVVKNYSDAQIKVREATSNDPWGPSSTLMSEIADLTYNVVAFTEIMQMVWKRLNDSGKNWRHVYKALVLLDYLVKTGSEKVSQQCKENIFAIQTLNDFQYIEDGKDHGMNVRERAKQLVGLLKDDERLKNERAKALKAKERFAQNSMAVGPTGSVSKRRSRHGSGSPTMHSSYTESFGADDMARHSLPTSYSDPSLAASGAPELEAARPSTAGEEELQLQLALAMSKEEHDEEEKKRKADEIKYQMAIEQSKRDNESQPFPKMSSSGPSENSLLDLAQGGQDPWGPPVYSAPDPWGAPAAAPTRSDPWAPTPPPAYMPMPTHSIDPWGPVSSTASTQSTRAAPQPADPWGDNSNSRSSPYPTSSNGTNHQGFGGIDDEFDLLSSTRTKSPANTLQMSNTNGGSSVQLDPWDMSMMHSNLVHDEQRNKTKSPADFLGANANLVNLDNLVTKPASKNSTNPFAMTLTQPAANPFQTTVPQRVPMNRMQTSASMGFEQTSSGTILPTPLAPNNPGMHPVQPLQPQGNNPFL